MTSALRSGFRILAVFVVLAACGVWQVQQPLLAQAGTSAITRSSWTAIGPGNIGGRVRALAVHPSSTSTIFAGGANGGIWRSNDAGASWQPVDDFLPSLAVTSIVFRPGDPATMYAGTGESFVMNDGARGAGILTSTDGGASWSVLPSTSNANFFYVNRLAMSADGNTLLAATSTGLFRSTNGGSSFTPVLTVSADSFGYTEIEDVKFLPGSSTNAIASGNSQNAYYSTNGGANWTAATGLVTQTANSSAPQSVEIGVSATSPSTVYLSVAANGGELWKSTNSGASYTKAGTPSHLTLFGSSANAIWVDPTNVNTIVVGGDDVYRSTNGGVSWTTISAKNFAPELSIHALQHIIVSDPGFNGSSNRRVYFGNEGGVWKTEDIYATPQTTGHICCNTIGFVSLNNGLAITQFVGGAGHAASGKIVGGSQGNGTLIYTAAGGANAWTILAGDDAGFAEIDPSDPNYIYGSFAYLRLYRSTTGGTLPASIVGCDKAAPYKLQDACDGVNNYTSPFLLDPNNPSRLLGGGLSLWRTNDARAELTTGTGPQWAAIKPSNGSPINAIDVPAGNSDVIWVGHNNGDVYVTTNGTAPSPVWQKVDGSALPDRQVNAIEVDARDTDVVYVLFDGFNADNVWKTTNAGATWSALAGVPALPMRSMTIDPRASAFLFLGTDRGLYTSRDGGATWDADTIGPARTAVTDLFWVGSALVAATHGRGMFATAVSSPVSASPASAAFTASRNAAGDVILTFTPAQTVAVTYTGGGTPAWSASSDRPWIHVAAATDPGTFSIAIVNPANAIGSSDSLSGTVTLTAANLGTSVTVPVTLTVLANGPSDPAMSLDAPAQGAVVPMRGFDVVGWAIDRGSPIGSGIDGAHVWAWPIDGRPGGPQFLGVGTVNVSRPDLGPFLGSQFTTSGFNFRATGLTPGQYRLTVYAHSAVTNAFTHWREVDITVAEVVSDMLVAVDSPTNGSTTGQAFILSGWAVDRGVEEGLGTGVDQIHVWAFPWVDGALGNGTFVGQATYGLSRPDVGAFLGNSQFTNSGYRLRVSGLSPGPYRLIMFAHSTVTGTFGDNITIDITIGTGGDVLMAVDQPAPDAAVTQPFAISGWAVDRATDTGTGVDQVHVWAYPVGGGSPIFAGMAAYGASRPDIGGLLGSQFTNCGYSLNVTGLPAGQYDLHFFVRSTVTSAFQEVRSIRIAIQ